MRLNLTCFSLFEKRGFVIISLKDETLPLDFIEDIVNIAETNYEEDLFREKILQFQSIINQSNYHKIIAQALHADLKKIANSENLLISGVAFLRVVRPKRLSSSYEYLDFHRESFYGTGDFVHKQINIHVPLYGYDDQSALKYVPMSHLIPDCKFILEQLSTQESGVIRGSAKHRSGMVYSPKKIISGCDLSSAIPMPVKIGEVAVFKSDLIHGAGENTSSSTRISIDFAVIDKFSVPCDLNKQLASYDTNGAKYVPF